MRKIHMCEMCNHDICPSSCPNAKFEDICGECEWCNDSIYASDEYYIDSSGNKFCSSICALKYYNIKCVESWYDA